MWKTFWNQPKKVVCNIALFNLVYGFTKTPQKVKPFLEGSFTKSPLDGEELNFRDIAFWNLLVV